MFRHRAAPGNSTDDMAGMKSPWVYLYTGWLWTTRVSWNKADRSKGNGSAGEGQDI